MNWEIIWGDSDAQILAQHCTMTVNKASDIDDSFSVSYCCCIY